MAEPGAQLLVPLRASTGEVPSFVHTLELTQVVGVAALVNIWRERDRGISGSLGHSQAGPA